ncbi:50S ribosomal protein L16 [Candidatus Phycorickettsia trachydisci]|uniref:Large ribosomal subunit protein uL16 n=1 Tax=Candidatus Phycorickettsia trachydisci TaxID=2115978 RepID=A0A2P1P8Y7_9RICK|nr:50S ribosomal protein L16 [Candidatus Phycorickettsia trachydisci]AVP87726.1 50S ribosomal protein L16 [Candidatus Phycorickettsia trachydisci]
MLVPKKQKFRKAHKGRIAAKVKRGDQISFGSFGLKALELERINSRQIEAARRAATRVMKREGKLWIRIFPDIPVSKKPSEVRMGKGKGSVEFYVARISPGRVLFEVDGVSDDACLEALRLAAAKLPLKTKVVKRYE